MEAKPGTAKLHKMAEWLEHEYPDAAASLLEGIDECFTINRLELPLSLHRCLAAIFEFLDAWNEDPQPFVWTATSGPTLGSTFEAF